MPIIIYMKQPPLSIVIEGRLNGRRCRKFRRDLGACIEGATVEGKAKALIPVSQDSNIIYAKDLSPKEYEILKHQRDEAKDVAAKGPRIEKPGMMIPGRKGH